LIGQDWLFVVRSIDSIRSHEDLDYCLSAHGVPHDVVHRNVCVTTACIWNAIAGEVLTGFDEVWVFSGGLPAVDLSGMPSATSETTNFSEDMPKDLMRAITTTGCVLVVGDGCGLNYATPDERIAEEITKTEAS
jgi:hypothetical protein